MSAFIKQRGNTYFFRLFIPPKLRHLCGGRGEIVRTLGTTDPNIARRRAAVWRARAEHLIELMSQGHTLTSEQIELELQRIVETRLDGYRDVEAAGQDPLSSSDPEETPADLAKSLAAGYWEDYQAGDYARVVRQAEDIVRRSGGALDIDSPLYHELCRGLLHAHAEIYRVQAARLRGQVHAAARLPLNPALAGAFGAAAANGTVRKALPPPNGPKFSEAAGRYLDQLVRDRGKRASTEAKYKATYRLFQEICGDLPVQAYTKADHVTPFLDVIRELPPRYDISPRWRGMSIREISAQNREAGGKRLAGKSVQNYIGAVSSLFTFLKERGEYQGENPATGLGLKKHSKSARRLLWEGQRLRKLLASPVWTGCKSEHRRADPGRMVIRDAFYWLPLLALYHGARLEELAQLQRKDFRREGDIWYFDITDEGGGKLKTEAARRRVPLNPALERLGFVEYATAESMPTAYLFPDLKPGGPDKKRGFYFTKEWTRYRERAGVYEPLLDFHSFRHGVRTKLASASVPESLINAITGHEGQGIGERIYTHREHIPLLALREALAKVVWPEAGDLLRRGAG
jgi:integrase